MTATPRDQPRWRAPTLWGLLLAALLVLPFVASIRYVFLTTEILIAILFATSLNLLMGYGGMLSLGHSAYFALASYTSGILLTNLGWSMVTAMLAGPVAATLGAVVFGVFVVRISHEEHAYFLMLTLAFSQLIFALIYKWYSVTRGDDGITGIYGSGIIGTPRSYCVFVVLVVALCLYALRRIVDSPFGFTLQAIRDNPRRAEFVGLSVRFHQLIAFVIAGLFAGIAGTLYAFFAGTISPQVADWGASSRPFLANVIGGVQSFWGPAVGVLLLDVIDSQVGRVTQHSMLAVGALAVFVGLCLPQGIMGLLGGSGPSKRLSLWNRLFPRRSS